MGSAYFCLATHETQHKVPSNFKDNNLQEEATFSSMRASFYHTAGLGSLRILSSFNETFLDELTWTLLVSNALVYLSQQDKLPGLVLVRVIITSLRGGKEEMTAVQDCPVSSWTHICHLAIALSSVIPPNTFLPMPKASKHFSEGNLRSQALRGVICLFMNRSKNGQSHLLSNIWASSVLKCT